jgi:hypothetical protein
MHLGARLGDLLKLCPREVAVRRIVGQAETLQRVFLIRCGYVEPFRWCPLRVRQQIAIQQQLQNRAARVDNANFVSTGSYDQVPKSLGDSMRRRRSGLAVRATSTKHGLDNVIEIVHRWHHIE